MSSFVKGQKVVCIHNGWTTLLGAEDTNAPTKGQVLTVISIFNYRGEAYLYFDELEHDRGYLSTGFRPVVERKTDISIFKAMLNPSKQTVEA